MREAAREAIEGWRECEYSLEADPAKEADAECSVGQLYELGDETPLAERLEEYPEAPDWVETYDTSGSNSLVLHCREIGAETRIELIEDCTQFAGVCLFSAHVDAISQVCEQAPDDPKGGRDLLRILPKACVTRVEADEASPRPQAVQ